MELRKYRRFIIGGGIVVLLFGGWLGVKLRAVNQQAVVVYTVKAASLQQQTGTNFSGKLEAGESANVVAKITGKVGAIKVDVGSPVKAGDILAVLEGKELAASVEQARASLEIVHSDWETSRLDYEVQKDNFERNQALVAAGALSQSEFDNKYAIPYAKAKEKVLRGAQAQVRQAEANLQAAEANYGYCTISSPITGIVAAKNINVGELANSEITLFSVVNIDKVFVMASIGEEKINQVHVGESVAVRVDAAADKPFPGIVTNVSPAAGLATKTYLVKVQIDNGNHLLKPGMFAEVLWDSPESAAVVIPKTALFTENGESYVWIVKDGLVSKQAVRTGQADTTSITIKSGLTNGQEVVIYEPESLAEGMKVTVHQ